MSAITKLAELFAQFPGIGPRQARRFVYFLLSKDERFIDELIRLLQNLSKETTRCNSCRRFFVPKHADAKTCPICSDASRDAASLMVVAKDVDLETVERAETYAGRYFVLGGLLPMLEEEPKKRIGIQELLRTVKARAKEDGLKEIILALPANPDGDNTAEYLAGELNPLSAEYGFSISTLGRGLSTGLELEYSDPETLKNALQNRK